jgi:hypothetical protein
MCYNPPKLISYEKLYKILPRTDIMDYKAIEQYNKFIKNNKNKLVLVLNEIYHEVSLALKEAENDYKLVQKLALYKGEHTEKLPEELRCMISEKIKESR